MVTKHTRRGIPHYSGDLPGPNPPRNPAGGFQVTGVFAYERLNWRLMYVGLGSIAINGFPPQSIFGAGPHIGIAERDAKALVLWLVG